MSYNSINAMANSRSLADRIAACAATLGNTSAKTWAGANILTLVASAPSTLVTAWDTSANNPDANPDTGACSNVITDAMLLSAVGALKAKQLGTQGWPTA